MERIKYNEIPNGMFEKLRAVEDYLNTSSIDLKTLELIRLRVSQINGCAYCVDMHNKELIHLGESDLRRSSLCVWRETPYFNERERTVLDFAELLNELSGHPISNETVSALSKYYSKEEICMITLAISQISTWNRLMKTFLFQPGNYQVAS